MNTEPTTAPVDIRTQVARHFGFEPVIPPPITPAAWSAADESPEIKYDQIMEHAALTLISRERERQRELLTKGTHRWSCADPVVSHDRKLRTLTEEVGEVAQAIDVLEGALARGASGGFERLQLRAELVQVAAVACACIEAILQEAEAETPRRNEDAEIHKPETHHA